MKTLDAPPPVEAVTQPPDIGIERERKNLSAAIASLLQVTPRLQVHGLQQIHDAQARDREIGGLPIEQVRAMLKSIPK